MTEDLQREILKQVQDDVRGYHCGLDPQSQNCAQGKVCTLTHALSKKKRAQKNDKNFAKGNVRFTPHVSRFTSKIPAFTLAEVLITLGVVGVIAAMTLPMLAENYQRIVVQTRLKKFYTTFNQAILRSVDVNGPYGAWGYEVNHYNPEAFKNSFDLYLRPYLNVVQTQEVQYTNGKIATLYYLADGSAFMYLYLHNRDIYYFPKDPVRCLQQPLINRMGVCRFDFNFVTDSYFYDPISKQDLRHVIGKGMEAYSCSWDGNPETLYVSTYNQGGCDLEQNGAYCTKIIQYNNWEFPKDYPRKIRY